MWVVKLGGSLASSDELRAWLLAISQHGRGRVVLVPGGGPFADAVRRAQRRWAFDDTTAHRMALHAMLQYGLLLTGLDCDADSVFKPAASERAIRATLDCEQVPVWLPVPMADTDTDTGAKIEASWRVTSDSLALWLAGRLGISRVVLVKSVAVAVASRHTLIAGGVLDAAFADYHDRYRGSVHCLGPGQADALVRALNDGAAPGTEIKPL